MADDADKAKDEAGEATGRSIPDVRVRPNQNEWTASDRRGPLGEATFEERGPRAVDADEPHGIAPGRQMPSDPPEPMPAAEPVEPSPDPTQARASADPPATQAPRRPVLPLVAALVVGALIGAASSALVTKLNDQGASQSDVAALASRIDALEKRPDLQPQLDQLKASVAQAAAQKPASPAPAFDPGPLQQKLDGLAGDVDALKKQDADHALADKVAALEAQTADVKGLDGKVAGLAAAIDGLKQQDQSAEAGIASLQNGQKVLEGKTGAPALAVAADSLVVAIAQGRPYAGQVDALASLGADPAKVAVLRENADKGVPSAQALAAQFAPLADPIVASASQTAPNAGFGDRLKSGLFGMVSIRRSDATSGDDVPSRVSRIEADLAHDDVVGAYETWNGLPAAAKAKSEAWGALAKTQVEAMGAARALQGQAIAALGGRKS